MKILYHNPPCGGGIEQAGYIFLLLLKKLGHQIDFWNTQCLKIQEEIFAKEIKEKKYDAIILHGPHRGVYSFLRTNKLNNLFIIAHTLDLPPPSFSKILSLNYSLQYKLLYHINCTNVLFPLTYPFWWGFPKGKISKNRKFFFIFVGRWNPYKFSPLVRNFIKEKKILIDLGIFYHEEKKYKADIFKAIKYDQPIEKIYHFLSQSTYILLPSITECISFVIGEAIANGCFPITFEPAYDVHEQFIVGSRVRSMEEFSNLVFKISQTRTIPPREFYDKFVPFFRRMWSIEKTLNELAMIFGKTKSKGKIIVQHSDTLFQKNLWYKNAVSITQEKI